MEPAALVRIIVQEVLKRVQPVQQAACVRILAPRSEALAARIAPLVEAWHGHVDLVFSGEESAGREVVRHILPELSCTDMADLVAGRGSCPHVREVLDLLLRGVRIDVLEFEYRRYAATAPGALYALYEGYERTLAGYGLGVFREKKPETVRRQESLITAQTVEEAGRDEVRTIKVQASAKITPLAREAADTLGIRIIRDN